MNFYQFGISDYKIVIYHGTGVVIPAGEFAGCGGEPPGAGGAVLAAAGAGRPPGAVAQHHAACARDVRAQRRAR